ncbi:MAG: branched-chain amino acid ABC transporter permease [Deltaproteobacteria bacterium]|nr:branched-chain amino acid ABC transporter permease [Deltaproteobacteria bacterium]
MVKVEKKKLIAAVLVIFLLFPLILPRFYVYLTSLIMIYGLLATSLNLVLGYGGIFQFHHCVFYGVGAYATALILTKTSLHPIFAFIAGPICGSVLSLILGIVCIRLSKLYFGMLQISLGSLVWAIVYRWYSFTGGDDGIHGIPIPEIFASTNGAFYFALMITTVSMFVIYGIVNSPFGKTLQGIRDNPVRCEMIGVNVRLHQLLALTISGFFAGVAGMLFVVVDTTVFPELLFWTLSLEVLIMCLVGGWFTFFGPMLGAGIIILLRTVVSTYTVYWALVLGIILTLVIFFLPNGVLGFIEEKFGRGLKRENV